jgi:LytS/YehU family sensor histidine kinase
MNEKRRKEESSEQVSSPMVFQGTAIPNLIIEIAGIMICLFALITIWYSPNRPIPFKEELEHVRHYVSLQQLRFGDALDVRYELRCTEFELPTLTLQPLVENAIRYGVRKSADGKGTDAAIVLPKKTK